jgi:hypothetical protein
MSRNNTNARIVLGATLLFGKLDGVVIDYAGGYGILVRLLRDLGIGALWSDSYCQNLLAKGFEYTNENATLVTSFEAFEHFVHPAEELDRLLLIAPNVLLSTELIADATPSHDAWWYYGKEHGQHIGFFRFKTLEKLAKDRGKLLLHYGGSYFLIVDKPISRMLLKLTFRGRRLLPFILRRQLTSKTWADHLDMAKDNL